MKTKNKSLLLLLSLLTLCMAAQSQSWEYVNVKQYRVKDIDAFQKYMKHSFPYFNKSQRAPVVSRVAGTSESGWIYTSTYFANYDQFANYLKAWPNEWEQYSKSPGNLAQDLAANLETGVDDILWKLNKELSVIPEGYDPSKTPWRKIYMITIKPGMMPEYVATWKKIIELNKILGTSFAIFVLNAVHGAPNNTLLISQPAESASAHYTAVSNRQKARQANPEITSLYKKISSLSSSTVIDHVTAIPY